MIVSKSFDRSLNPYYDLDYFFVRVINIIKFQIKHKILNGLIEIAINFFFFNLLGILSLVNLPF